MPIDFNTLMITDSRNADAASKLKSNDPRFIYATIVEVHTVDAFIDELRKPVITGVLVLALDGDKNGAIEIDGAPLDLKDLTGVNLVVEDGIYLEGTSIKPFGGAATLNAKLMAPGSGAPVRDEWIVLEFPEVAVVVDDNDKWTHEVASTKGHDGLTHFVTVQEKAKKGMKGSKVTLHAKLVNANTAANRKQLKWDAPPKYAVPNDQWTVQIPREKVDKVQIPLMFKGNVVKQVVVWVVWCDLSALTTLESPLNHDKLGSLQPRTTGALEAIGNVDWLITIKPPQIISDADRPDLEHQKKQKVPGEKVVPEPFFGWELATDVRMLIKKVTPAGKHVVLSGKTDPGGMYRWASGDAEGLSTADEHEDPYAPDPVHGWPSRWELSFEDSSGEPGETRAFHKQARVFERVQLDTAWYRCSDIKRYRLKASAKKLPSGQWKPEPHTKPLLELNNKNW